MKNKVLEPPPGFDDLPVHEQLDYVQSLWERIAVKPDSVPVPDWHREIIEERLRTGGVDGKPWPEFRDEILARISNRHR